MVKAIWYVYCIPNEATSTLLLTIASLKLVLVWSPGRGSPVHDHGNAHCLMKILKGNLTETRYAFPQHKQSQPLNIISERTHIENDVAYMADDLGLHRMSNRGSDFAVSLHCKPQVQPYLSCVYHTDDLDSSIYSSPRSQERLLCF